MEFSDISQWIIDSRFEIFGTVTALIYLYFSIRQNILLWFFGILSSAVYVYVFIEAGVYADMAINIYYIFISVYGWYTWISAQNNHKKTLEVSRTPKEVISLLAIITPIIWVVLWFILKYFTNSDIPAIDSFTTAGSIVATWMLTKKYLEQWLLWVVIDGVSIGMFVYKELYFTVFLFTIYTAMAIIGYQKWKKEYEIQNNLQESFL